MRLCANCDEAEHDCCLNLLRPGTCPCTHPADSNLDQPPAITEALFVILGQLRSHPGRPVPGRRPVPPWPPGFFCGRHHLIEGDNAVYDSHQRRWFCRKCRRDSWRRSTAKRRNREEVA